MGDIQVLSRTQVITVHSDQSVSITNAGPIGPPGIQGPPGNDGVADINRFEQDTPAGVWDVVHNLDREPLITVIVDGHEVLADVLHISSNQFTVTHATPKSGVVLYV